jgi:hypothetical protein
MSSLLLVLVFSILAFTGLCFHLKQTKISHNFSRMGLNAVDRGQGSGDDYDTSEMVAMSSSEIAALKEAKMLKVEAGNSAAIQDTIKDNIQLTDNSVASKAPIQMPAESAKKSKTVSFPTESVSMVDTSAMDDNKALPLSAGNSGFDLGLLIAFPVIVGTLALFFLFPFLGEKLAGGSGPLDPDMLKGM